MMHRIGDDPSVDFVATVRRELLSQFTDGSTQATLDESTTDVFERRPSNDHVIDVAPHESASRRRLGRKWMPVAAAAAVVAVLVAAIVLHQREPDATITNTKPPAPFSRHVVTDIGTPSGSIVHFDGTVGLPIGVESNESSSLPIHDVLLIPEVSATFTNAASAEPVPVALAFVEIFLRGHVAQCVANSGTCEPGIIRGQTTATDPVRTLGRDESITVTTAGEPSRISAPAEDVPGIIERVHDGSIVVGFAIVVGGGSASDVSSTIFDRNGEQVLSCNSLPEDCMDSTR